VKTPRALKKRIVRETQAAMRSRYAGPAHAACLYWAANVIQIASRYGVRLIPQAGSASWARVPLAEDDGVIATHFSYEWQGIDAAPTRAAIDAGVLPELHVWAADPRAMEIVDLTTGYQALQCVERIGLEWRTPPLPAWLWAGRAGLPEGTVYRPAEDATRFVVGLITRNRLGGEV